MSTYIVRRLLQAVPLLILISMVVFGLIALAPGGVGEMYEGNPDISAADAARLEAQLGLDQPLYIRYWHWARRVAVGDWGTSLVTRRPVLAEIGARLPYTLQLMSAAFVVMLLIALPIGVHSALHPYSLFDHVATFWAFVGQAIPIFWFGLLLIMLFNVLLHNPTSPSTGFAWSHLWDCADCKPLLPGGGVALPQALHGHQPGRQHFGPMALEDLRPDDHVDRAAFVLERDEDGAAGGLRALAMGDDAAGGDDPAVGDLAQFGRGARPAAGQPGAQQGERVLAHRDAERAIVGQRALAGRGLGQGERRLADGRPG